MNIFYKNDISSGSNKLPEEESKHCAKVLRRQAGDEIVIFDGKGGKYRALLKEVSQKICSFEVISEEIAPLKNFSIHLGIALTKNMERMEWLVEKLCEIGVDELTPIYSKHSERRKLRMDRLEKKAISAMKQSKNPFLLKINSIKPYEEFLAQCESDQKLIAHVDDRHPYMGEVLEEAKSATILIGPEGDFAPAELHLAISHHFQPVSLGKNTLRTETAGLVACCMVNFKNQY